MKEPKIGDLRVYWFPQLGCDAFFVDVASPEEAKKLLDVLAHYDQFQLDHRIKPDYCNAGGLEICEEDGRWYEWASEDGDEIDDYEVAK
jgi:hypothetical protein